MPRDISIESLSLHPDAGRVPEMPAGEYAAFLGDVRDRGIKVPIEVIPGTQTVIDGRTRLRAARDAGLRSVPVVDANLNGESPIAYMLRAALTRRHLTSSQRAALAVELEAELAKVTKKRQRATIQAQGHRGKEGGRGKKKPFQEIFPERVSPPAPQARDQAADAANTNHHYVSDAKVIQAKAPELLEKVKVGELTLPQARQELRRQEKRAELQAKATVAAAAPTTWEVIAGDCLTVLPTLSDRPRLIFADPPYNVGVDYGKGARADRLPDYQYLAWVGAWINACHEALAPDGTLWVLINDEYAAEYAVELKRSRFTIRSWVIWYETFGVNCPDRFNRTKRHLFYCVKNPRQFVFHPDAVSRPSDRQTKYADRRAAPGGKILDDVWTDIPRLVGTAAERVPDFPTQLPLALLRRVVACSSDPGDLVLDPFSGSGTTGAACIELDRRFVGIEWSAVFADLSRLRLRGVTCGDLTGTGAGPVRV
jgi:site-specific DNA-methyltransferase (adenine-specific)